MKICRSSLFYFVVFVSVLIPFHFTNAQKTDTLFSGKPLKDLLPVKFSDYQLKPFVLNAIPGMMIMHGFATFKNDELRNWNYEAREELWEEHPHTFNHMDNYLQYAPAFSVYALNIAGIHGKNNLWNCTVRLSVASAFTAFTVMGLKNTIHSERPDGTDKHSFPSGHTATAFMGAELLRQEFKEVSVWIPVAGYAVATTTGYMRLYNDKHWASDVVTGAAIGVLSAQLSCYITERLKQKHFLRKHH